MNLKAISAAVVLASFLGNAQAALFDRGGGLIYDDVLNITWLQDANYAKTSGYDADGRMKWTTAMTWASSLSYGGYDDWRLPTALNQWAEHGETHTEMGHLFFLDIGLINYSLESHTIVVEYFTNMESYAYWSSTGFQLAPDDYKWAYRSGIGNHIASPNNYEFFALAVRDGDVAAPIPEPETYAMMLAGLGLLGFMARRRKRA